MVMTITGTTGSVWRTWTATNTSASSSSTVDLVWDSWTANSNYPTSTTVSTGNNLVWNAWSSGSTGITTGIYQNTITSGQTSWNSWVTHNPALKTRMRVPVRTPEQEREHREREAVRAARFLEEDKKRRLARNIAIGKADALLESILNQAQRVQLRQHNWFLVRSESGKIYRIRKGRHINVDEVDEVTGQIVRTLCAHPYMDVPDGDTVATQKLMLQFEEKEFLKIAAKHSPRGPAVPVEELRYVN